MLGLHWKKAIPNPGSKAFVCVSDEANAAVVAGAFKERDDELDERRFRLTNDGFYPGVYDHKTRSCAINNANAEQEFYVLAKTSNVQYDWIPERDGQIPTGAVQCGFNDQGEPLYAGRFKCDGRFLCGKVNSDLKRCEITVPGKQYWSEVYDVLCLKTIPIGFTYNSAYNLRSKLSLPATCNSITQLNGTSSFHETPMKVSRTVTSSESKSITLRKFKDVPVNSSLETPQVNTSTTLLPKALDFESPSDSSTTVLPKAPLDFESPSDSQRTSKENGKVSSSTKRQRYSPMSRWQRFGSGSRLVRSPSSTLVNRMR